MASTRPAKTLKALLPKNGMTWHPSDAVTHRRRVDEKVVRALRSLGVVSKRDVQVAITHVVDAATDLARQTPRDVERSEFALALRNQTPLGRALSPAHFEQLFVAIVLARQRYLDDRWEADLPVEDPAAHSHMARAVDAFEVAAAPFWSSVEALFEDGFLREEEPDSETAEGAEPPSGGASSLAATTAGQVAVGAVAGGVGVGVGGVGGGVGGGQATAFPSDPAYVSLAVGVSAMEIDDVGVVGDAGGAEVGTGVGGWGSGGGEDVGGDAMDIDE